MTDSYAELRAALAAGPTPGPWAAEYDSPSDAWHVAAGAWPYGETICVGLVEDHARLIAAANPNTIAALLAELDDARKELQAVLGDWNDLARAIGSPTNGGAIGRARALAQDAARYRWLRSGGNNEISVCRGFDGIDMGASGVAYTFAEFVEGKELDIAIDAAIKEAP